MPAQIVIFTICAGIVRRVMTYIFLTETYILDELLLQFIQD